VYYIGRDEQVLPDLYMADDVRCLHDMVPILCYSKGYKWNKPRTIKKVIFIETLH